MRFVRCCTLLGLTLVLGGAPAAPPPEGRDAAKDREKAAGPAAADMTCADGSTVRVALVTENVELETKYGKLTIPAADVQRIEFAFRLPDDLARKVAAAVKRLGDARFEEREAASKELRLLTRVRALLCLGSFAWDGALRVARALGHAARPRPVFGHGVAAVVGPYTLLGSYHPSQQNTFTGRLTEAMLDGVLERAKEVCSAD